MPSEEIVSRGGAGELPESTAAGSVVHPHVLVEGIKAFGRNIGIVTAADLRMEMSATDQLHLLRRFDPDGLRETYLSSLEGQSISEDFDARGERAPAETTIDRARLEKEMSSPCSKFYPEVSGFSNPLEAMQSIQRRAIELAESGELTWIEADTPEGKVAKTYVILDLDAPVGASLSVPLAELTPEQASSVNMKGRSQEYEYQGEDFMVPTLEADSPQPSSRVCAVLKHALTSKGEIDPDSPTVLQTAWVGDYTPPLPDDGQPVHEQAYYHDFHTRLVRLVVKE